MGSNYAPGYSPNPTISAIAADGTTVLEADDLSVLAPFATMGVTNSGAFRGITLATPTIRFLRVGGAFIIEHDITTAGPAGPGPSPVPEPSTFLLAFISFIALWGVALARQVPDISANDWPLSVQVGRATIAQKMFMTTSR